jgi:glycine cleavage system H lipoate-binding protein
MAHDFLSIYPAKLQEYLLAIAYLLLFIPFWKYVQGGKRAEAREAKQAHAPAKHAGATALRPTAGWFHAASGLHFHPGHTWARLDKDGLVTVGIDDFAHKLIGSATVELPAPGDRVAQGEPALSLADEGRLVPMLSPIDGTVVAVNPALKPGDKAVEDVYGAGWLFKVKAPRLVANLRQLHAPGTALRLMEEQGEALARRLSPELGLVLQDGGTPVHGIARALAGDDWDTLAREYFLT